MMIYLMFIIMDLSSWMVYHDFSWFIAAIYGNFGEPMGAKSQAHHLESDHDVTRPASAHGATLQLHPTLPHLVVRQGMEPRNFEAKPMGLPGRR